MDGILEGFEIASIEETPKSRRFYSRRILEAFMECGEQTIVKTFIDAAEAKSFYNSLKVEASRHSIPVSVKKKQNKVYLIRKDAE